MFIVVLQVIFQPALSVLFTVEAEQTEYNSEFGGTVVMGCRFSNKPSENLNNLKVSWLRVGSSSVLTARFDSGAEQTVSPAYHGRVELLTEELRDGWAKLQISRLMINDSGKYQCLVHTDEGSDYKTLSLSVAAPYKTVIKRVEKAADCDQVLISCQSEGFPESSVLWQDGHMQTLNANTTVASTPDQLFQITSQIQVSSSEENNYTCHFTKDGTSATFLIPDEIPVSHIKSDALIILLSIGVITVIIAVGLFIYGRKKGT
uniref:Ig-like domain-containing protein n=1 Tax=Salarias fasciatus TaxID=181472 RepID=A0A672JE96_SALFA